LKSLHLSVNVVDVDDVVHYSVVVVAEVVVINVKVDVVSVAVDEQSSASFNDLNGGSRKSTFLGQILAHFRTKENVSIVGGALNSSRIIFDRMP